MRLHKLTIYSIPLIAVLFAIIVEPFSFFIWISILGLGNFVSKKLFSSIQSSIDFTIIYCFISILGLIISIDNFFNFGSLLGFAIDDESFLNGTKYLVGQEDTIDREVSFFSYFLLLIAYPVSLIKEVSLTDLLPVNWMLAGLIGVLLDKLSMVLTKRNIPLFLLLLSFPLQFIMTDTLTRLYRDNLLLFFYVITFINIFRNKFAASILPIILTGLLRGANLVSYAFLIFFKIFKVNRKIFFPLFILSSFLIVSNLPLILKTAMIYGSDITRANRYSDAFSNLDYDELIKSRYNYATSEGNPLRQKAYSSTSATSIALRGVFSYFFPLTFSSPFSDMKHARKGDVKGFYLYYMVNWINILVMVFTTPLLIIGMFKSKGTELYTLLMVYISYLFLVLLISGQGRHSCGAYIFNAVFIANGYYFTKRKKLYRQMWISSSIILMLVVFVYNVLKFT